MSLELRVRPPAVAGAFYPASADRVRRMIEGYLADAPELDLPPPRAVVAPHAGYVYSGPTAGYAFKAVASLPHKKRTVYLLGPAHRAWFRGVALGAYSAFRTPLGDVPVATDRIEELVERSPLYAAAPEAHAEEHCLEVEVPFLQMTLPDFQLVPMLFGEVDPRAVGEELSEHLGADDFVVVSSDLSHFFDYQTAQRLDRGLLDAVLAGDEAGVLGGEACGRAPMVALMEIARRKGWTPHLLDYRNSGDTAGDKWRVVGYASIAYTE